MKRVNVHLSTEALTAMDKILEKMKKDDSYWHTAKRAELIRYAIAKTFNTGEHFYYGIDEKLEKVLASEKRKTK